MRTATKLEIRQIEDRAIAGGLSAQRLMENAGTAAAHAIRRAVGTPQDTAILCGKGNNGGDGFVIARKLSENGYPVTVILPEGEPDRGWVPWQRSTCFLLRENKRVRS